jgi:hypothetical protein
LSKDLVEARSDGALAGSVAVTLHVGGVLKEAEDALLAEFCEGMEVEGLAVWWGEVDLEVASVEHDPYGGVNGEGDTVNQ